MYALFVRDEQRNHREKTFSCAAKKEKQKQRFGKKVQMAPTFNIHMRASLYSQETSEVLL